MARPFVWFVAGVLATVLVLGGVAVGATQMGDGAKAQGVWQIKTTDNMKDEDGAYVIMAFIMGLPSECDIAFFPSRPDWLAYRCPE